jgi:hypothetical protein
MFCDHDALFPVQLQDIHDRLAGAGLYQLGTIRGVVFREDADRLAVLREWSDSRRSGKGGNVRVREKVEKEVEKRECSLRRRKQEGYNVVRRLAMVTIYVVHIFDND